MVGGGWEDLLWNSAPRPTRRVRREAKKRLSSLSTGVWKEKRELLLFQQPPTPSPAQEGQQGDNLAVEDKVSLLCKQSRAVTGRLIPCSCILAVRCVRWDVLDWKTSWHPRLDGEPPGTCALCGAERAPLARAYRCFSWWDLCTRSSTTQHFPLVGDIALPKDWPKQHISLRTKGSVFCRCWHLHHRAGIAEGDRVLITIWVLRKGISSYHLLSLAFEGRR